MGTTFISNLGFFVLLFLSSYLELITLCLGHRHLNVKCIETEREALLVFKEGLMDPAGRLSSWAGEDCCNWRGIGCNNQTGHVTKLHLRNPFQPDDYEATMRSSLGGKIAPSLMHLKYLNYLDLSNNGFEGIKIPKFFGMLKNLRYLNLSYTSFVGEIPPHLGNLSSLHYLDLSNSALHSKTLHWLSGLSSLKYLNLEDVNLEKIGADWLHAINMLPSLLELNLCLCELDSLLPSLPLVNFTSLLTLDMSANSFNTSIPVWLFSLTSLRKLDLSSNSFGVPFPSLFGNFCKLEILDLSSNYFNCEIHEFLGGFSACPKISLVSLNLGATGLVGELPESLGVLGNLQYLDLSGNSLWGSIPASIGNLSSLKVLDLSFNQMNKSIPESFGQLSQLVEVNLIANSWEGFLTETHLMNLTKLESIILKTDPPHSLIFNVTYDWVPPFRLKQIYFENCLVGPAFPVWLQCQTELTSVTLKNTGISDSIAQEWFSRVASQTTYLDLSNNQIKGKLPRQLESPNLNVIDLSYNSIEGPLPLWFTNATRLYLQENLFSGPLPENIDELMPQLQELYLTENRLNESIPPSICEIKGLKILSLGSNRFSGELPHCWDSMQVLWVVDISNNSLSGSIPVSIGSLSSLNMLMLSDNNLVGEIPSSLQNCSSMMSLDLGGNKLSGNLPLWIGENLSSLFILRLRSNLIGGNIPQQLCNLPSLHILDLAHNNLSGVIPKCFGNLTALVYGNSTQIYFDSFRIRQSYYEEKATVMTKGRELEYTSTLVYVNSIDLAGNNLSGTIPDEISVLSTLGILNLSMNHLSGSIPKKIGSLRLLETLDLSHNHLSGPIPQSLASLSLLTHLDLSYNSLVGRIPSGNQLQTLNASSIYEGNPSLCGDPLPMKCPGDEPSTRPPVSGGDGLEDDKDGNDSEKLWFRVTIGLGYIVGFWGVCGTLVVKHSWRHAYFRFFDDMKDKIGLLVALKVAHLQRKIGMEKKKLTLYTCSFKLNILI